MTHQFLFLVGHPRSGTHAAGSLIGKNSAYTHVGEVFNFRGDEHEENYFNFAGKLEPRLLLQQHSAERFKAYLTFLQEKMPERRPILDMKYDVLHLFDDARRELYTHPQVFDLLRDAGYPVVHLTRNVLEIFISGQHAAAAKQFHIVDKPDSEVRESPPLNINVPRLIAYLQQKTNEVQEARRFFKSVPNSVEIDYRTLFKGDAPDRARLFAFLGIEDRGAAPRYRKQISKPYRDLIENYDEMAARVRTSPFADLLADLEDA